MVEEENDDAFSVYDLAQNGSGANNNDVLMGSKFMEMDVIRVLAKGSDSDDAESDISL